MRTITVQSKNTDSEKEFRTERKKVHEFYRTQIRQWRQKIALIIFAVFAISELGLLIYHPYFQISTITVDGVRKEENKQRILDASSTAIQQWQGKIIPGSSIWFYPKRKLIKKIQGILPSRFIQFRRSLPNTLTIIVEEEDAKAIFIKNDEQYLMNRKGELIQKISEKQKLNFSLPLLSITLQGGKSLEELPKNSLPDLFDFIDASDETLHLPITTITINANEPYLPIEAQTKEGIRIYLRGDQSIQTQTKNFLLIMKEKNKKQKGSIREYIDLRFGERIYYK